MTADTTNPRSTVRFDGSDVYHYTSDGTPLCSISETVNSPPNRQPLEIAQAFFRPCKECLRLEDRPFDLSIKEIVNEIANCCDFDHEHASQTFSRKQLTKILVAVSDDYNDTYHD